MIASELFGHEGRFSLAGWTGAGQDAGFPIEDVKRDERKARVPIGGVEDSRKQHGQKGPGSAPSRSFVVVAYAGNMHSAWHPEEVACFCELLTELLKLDCIEAQICHATHVKHDALANSYKAKKHVLAAGAARHDTGALHI